MYMLTFSEHLIDQELLLAETEELQENILRKVLDALDTKSKTHLSKHIKTAQTSKDPKELERLSGHEHFGVRIHVARNPNTSRETLKKLASDSSEYRSVQKQAKERLDAEPQPA